MKIYFDYDFISLNEYINNERNNKYSAAKIKKQQTNYCACIFKKYKEDFEFIDFPLKLVFTWHLKSKKMDLDNITFAKKFIIDGLVSSGCIENDGQKQINEFADKIKYSDKKGVEIEIIQNNSIQ